MEEANIDEKRSEVCTEAGPELALCGWVGFKERAKAKHPRGRQWHSQCHETGTGAATGRGAGKHKSRCGRKD